MTPRGLGGRTMRSPSFSLFLASVTPFSQSETVLDPLLSGSLSSVVEDPFRFFRRSDHVPYKYIAPNNTDTVALAREKAGTRRV